MAIFLTGQSRVMIQGITGSEGRRHGARMLAAGTRIVGGTNPRKAGQTVELNGTDVPVFGTVADTMAATGAVPRELLQAARGWDDDAWDASAGTLIERGWIDEDGTQTTSGAAARQEVEDLTDLLAAEPWERLGADDTEALRAVLTPLASAIAASGSVPVPNPIGLPLPR